MAQILGCPECGETDDLTGRDTDNGIEVVCGRCQAAWLRGTPRCQACGGADAETRRQVMARHPRGNQLAIIGRREVVLCPRCDSEVLGRDPQALVPEGYVSRFLFGMPSTTPTSCGPPSSMPASPETSSARPASPQPTAHAGTTTARPAPTPPAAATTRPRPPTVREAIAMFLAEQPDANSLAMVMLGQHLGPARRMTDLDRVLVEQLDAWIDATWSNRPEDHRQAIHLAVSSAVAFWRRRGWLSPPN